MTVIYIKDLIGRDILNRISARDILDAINNLDDTTITLNFEGVQFTTRSFMDEFYNIILFQKPSGKVVHIEAMSNDLAAMLEVVSKTQHNSVTKVAPQPYVTTKTIDDMKICLQNYPSDTNKKSRHPLQISGLFIYMFR